MTPRSTPTVLLINIVVHNMISFKFLEVVGSGRAMVKEVVSEVVHQIADHGTGHQGETDSIHKQQ